MGNICGQQDLEQSLNLDSFKSGGRMIQNQHHLMPSIADSIGNTPLVDLQRFIRNSEGIPAGCRILAKCENMNPGMSKKDRIALQMIQEAEKSGKLLPG